MRVERLRKSERHQLLQVLNDLFGRERFVRGEGGTGFFAAATLHAGVQAEELLLAEMVYGTGPEALALFHLFHGYGREAAQARPGEEKMERPGDDVEQARVRNRSDETKDQQSMKPPDELVRRARAGFAQPGKPARDPKPHRRTAGANAGRLLPSQAQPLDEIAGDANGQEGENDIPIRWPMTNTGRPTRPPPEKEQTTRQKKQSKDVQRELIDDVISPSMEFECAGDSRKEVVNFQHGGAEEQHHEPGEQGDMGPTRESTAQHALLPQRLRQQAPQAGSQPGPDLAEVPGDQLPHADGDSLTPEPVPPPHAEGQDRQGQHGQKVENDDGSMRDVAERFAGGGHEEEPC